MKSLSDYYENAIRQAKLKKSKDFKEKYRQQKIKDYYIRKMKGKNNGN